MKTEFETKFEIKQTKSYRQKKFELYISVASMPCRTRLDALPERSRFWRILLHSDPKDALHMPT